MRSLAQTNQEKRLDDIIGPKIRKDVKDSEDFLASYEVGFPVPNF